MANSDEDTRTALVKSVSRAYDGFLKVDVAEVSHPRFDGTRQTVKRESMERGDAVAVVIVDTVRRLVWLTEQFRYPTLAKGPGWIDELPAGMPQEGESFEDAAHREVAEETGFTGLDLEHISTFYVSPGGTSERIVLFAAFVQDLEPDPAIAEARRDCEEDILMKPVPLEDFLAAGLRGYLDDAKTLIASLWLRANQQRMEP